MSIKNLFSKIKLHGCTITALKPQEAPLGIKKKRQRTILKFAELKSYDMYSACEIANDIVCCVEDSYNFFRHEHRKNKIYTQVISESGLVTTIRSHNLLKHRVAALSAENSEIKADELLRACFSSFQNRKDFRKISQIHNSAIYSDSINDSLLALWSMVESLVENDESKSSKQPDEEKDTKDKGNRSKTGKVISYILPFLKSTYIPKLIQTCIEQPILI